MNSSIESKLNALKEEVAFLEENLQEDIAFAYIEKHEITLEKIEFSDGIANHSFGELQAFTNWIEMQDNPKPFFEWHGTLYKYEPTISLRTPVKLKNLTDKKHNTMADWPAFKTRSLRRGNQPFMAWLNGYPIHQSTFNPAFHTEGFFRWLDRQEKFAKSNGATFCSAVFPSGFCQNKTLL